MNPSELDNRLTRMESQLRHTVRAGEVTRTNPGKGTVVVKFEDADGFETREVPVIKRNTCKNKEHCMPDVGEQVVCSFQGHGQEQGFCHGAIYSKKDKPPCDSQDKYMFKFSDGSSVEFDRSSGVCSIKAKTIKIDGDVEIKGNLQVEGNIHATGVIIDASGNTNHHTH